MSIFEDWGVAIEEGASFFDAELNRGATVIPPQRVFPLFQLPRLFYDADGGFSLPEIKYSRRALGYGWEIFDDFGLGHCEHGVRVINLAGTDAQRGTLRASVRAVLDYDPQVRCCALCKDFVPDVVECSVPVDEVEDLPSVSGEALAAVAGPVPGGDVPEELGAGFCYLQLVGEQDRAAMAERLGPWPEVSLVAAYCAGVTSFTTDGLRLDEKGPLLHVGVCDGSPLKGASELSFLDLPRLVERRVGGDIVGKEIRITSPGSDGKFGVNIEELNLEVMLGDLLEGAAYAGGCVVSLPKRYDRLLVSECDSFPAVGRFEATGKSEGFGQPVRTFDVGKLLTTTRAAYAVNGAFVVFLVPEGSKASTNGIMGFVDGPVAVLLKPGGVALIEGATEFQALVDKGDGKVVGREISVPEMDPYRYQHDNIKELHMRVMRGGEFHGVKGLSQSEVVLPMQYCRLLISESVGYGEKNLFEVTKAPDIYEMQSVIYHAGKISAFEGAVYSTGDPLVVFLVPDGAKVAVEDSFGYVDGPVAVMLKLGGIALVEGAIVFDAIVERV